MADVILTVNSDKTIGLSTQSLGSQGERVSVDVVIPAAVAALGYEAYIDFLLPNGVSYYKGGYDCSSAAFTFGLGETDSVMDKDGEVQVQFWVGTIVAAIKTVHWATAIKKTKVNQSIGATSAAILPYLPQMVIPASYPAANISLEDAANRFTAAQVEAALAEIAGTGRTSQTVKGNADNIATNAASIVTIKGAGWTNQTIKANADAIAVINANHDGGKSVYATKDAATDSTFTVTFPKNTTGFMLFATWDGKKILNIGRYITGVAQNSVSNFEDTGAYTFNSAHIGLLYLDGANLVALSCSGIVDNVATIVQSKTGTCTGTLRLIFVAD